MKRILIISVITAISIAVNGQPQKEKFPELKGLYLGQKTPGMTPEIFAPGIVSVPDFTEYSGTFSADGTEYYFYRFSKTLPPTIFFSKLTGGKWTAPEPASFSKGYPAFEPHLTFDNKNLYFAWAKPLPAGVTGDPNMPGIWVTTRTANGWSDPAYAGQGMFVSSDRSGHIYITDMSTRNMNGKTTLAQVEMKDGRFTGFEKLSISPEFEEGPAHPYPAPDGSYMLFDVGGGNHMFVSFKKKDGSWGEAIDLADHGFDKMAGGATISPDGKYLFFHLKGDIWWVDIKVIENLRPKID